MSDHIVVYRLKRRRGGGFQRLVVWFVAGFGPSLSGPESAWAQIGLGLNRPGPESAWA